MYKIIQTRPFEMKELEYGRLLKPFEDANMVEYLENTVESNIEFLIKLILDHSIDHKHYEHILQHTHSKMTIEEIYRHLTLRDSYIPTLYIVNDKSGIYSNFRIPKNKRDLESILKTLKSREIIDVPDRLLKTKSGHTKTKKKKITTKELYNECFDLLSFVKQKKHKTILEKAYNSQNAESAIKCLIASFPTIPIIGVSDDLIVELAGILSDIIFEYNDLDAFKDYLETTSNYLSYQQIKYESELKDVTKNLNSLNYQIRSGYIIDYSKSDIRKNYDYTNEILNQLFKILTINEEYWNYFYGYYHSQNNINKWLNNMIKQTLRRLIMRKFEDNKNITVIYSKNNCPKCMMTKRRLDASNIPYEEVNIETSGIMDEYIQYLKKEYKGQMSLPFVFPAEQYNLEPWSDLKMDKIDELISKAK